MFVHKLSLHNFRNYERLDIELDPGVNVFYGDNAQGKTNLLEAITYCATGHSQRTNADRELIRFHCGEAHIRLLTEARGGPSGYGDRIDVHLKRDAPKGVAVNGAPISQLSRLFGVLLAVAFSPEDLNLVKAGPAARRRFMDMELCQISRVYCHELQQYHRALKQRNNLLKSARRDAPAALADTLPLWDEQLARHGAKIMAHRRAFIRELGEYAGAVHGRITNGREKLVVAYKPDVLEDEFPERLRKGAERDVLLGTTGAGPHRDDMSFTIGGADARAYGSQGQQRTASLSVKLAEIDIIRGRTGRSPVLLLDDVLSELDEGRQTILMECLAEGQAIVTCTGLESVVSKAAARFRAYRVDNGVVL